MSSYYRTVSRRWERDPSLGYQGLETNPAARRHGSITYREWVKTVRYLASARTSRWMRRVAAARERIQLSLGLEF